MKRYRVDVVLRHTVVVQAESLEDAVTLAKAERRRLTGMHCELGDPTYEVYDPVDADDPSYVRGETL